MREACRWCGGRLDVQRVEVTTMADPEPRFVVGAVSCRTPDCGPRCPTCRREPGDIHGPHCGDVIADKLGDLSPCTITRADCGPRLVESAAT